MSAYLSVGGFLFEQGAVLGWTFRDRQIDFIQVITLPYPPEERIARIRLTVKGRVEKWKSSQDSFYLFIYETELARLGHPINMITSEDEDLETCKENMRNVSNWVKKQHFDILTAWNELHFLFYEGIGYGFEFPEETQRKWEAVYAKVKTPDDLISWKMAYQYGVVTTPEPAPIQTWDEHVSEMKDALRGYITEFKPELTTLFTE